MNIQSIIIVALLASLLHLFSCRKETALKPDTGVAMEQAFPNKTGEWKTANVLGGMLVYQEINGKKIVDGDIVIIDPQVANATATDGTYRTANTSRWLNKTVFYTIDSKLPNPARVMNAIEHWASNTNIKFIKRNNQPNYVVFTVGEGCSSNIGRIGGVQYVSVGITCSVGNIIHEIGHTLGLWHEHIRNDRDKYVRINYANISQGNEGNFKTLLSDVSQAGGGLDFASIMMYAPDAFSKNGLPTIVKKDNSSFVAQRSALSAKDKEAIRIMYP